ncbi:MAG: RidA family protein [Bacteroidota bacterium]|nr:RidA family protein [Bacteroidota bacterium]
MEPAKPTVQYINPNGLHKNPAFSQVVVTKGSVRTIYIGGPNAVSESGDLVGKGDIKAQAERVLKNLKTALHAGGANLENVIKWTIYVVQGQQSQPAFGVFQQKMRSMPNPLITLLYVSGLAHPDFLIEIEATAVIPE